MIADIGTIVIQGRIVGNEAVDGLNPGGDFRRRWRPVHG